MRLICPNCDAQYEVDASLVPSTGRDVQCSNCGKTWFQEPVETLRLLPENEVREAPEADETTASADQVEPSPVEGRSGDGLTEEAAEFFGRSDRAPASEDLIDEDEAGFEQADVAASVEEPAQDLIDETQDYAAEASVAVEEAQDTVPDTVAEAEPEGPLDYVAPEPEREPEPSPEPDRHYDYEDDGELAVAQAPVETELERPAVDSAVLNILKAEAEREIAARRAEEGGVETQPDLGLSEPEQDRDRSDIEARTARLRGAEEETDTSNGSTRRSVLPDIDEINSTLTATTEREAANDAAAAAVHVAAAETVRKRRSGFRFGFSLMIMAATGLILLYLYAPQISEAAPSTTPALVSYVDWANGVRQSVDVYLSDGVERLTTILVGLTT